MSPLRWIVDLDRLGASARNLAARRPRWTESITSVGLTVMILAVVSWLAGWWFGWNEFMYIAAGALVALLIALAFTFGKTDLEIAMSMHPARVTVGDRVVAEVVVRNRSSRRMLPVRLEIPVGRNLARMDVPTLGADEEWSSTLIIPTSRRSVVRVGPVKSVRSDPLHLLRREVRWTGVTDLFVHPITTPLSQLAAGWMRDLEGEATQDLSNSDLNFHALRDYVKGDDRRHIHWRTSVRLGKWMVRQFVDTRRSHLALMLSTNPADYLDADEFELAVSMVASLGLRAMFDGQSVDLIAGSERAATPTGQAFMDRCSRIEFGDSLSPIGEIALVARSVAPDASIAAFASGSGSDPGELRVAAARFSRNVRALGIRAAVGGESRFVDAGTMTLIEAGSLESFAQAMWSVKR